MRIYKLRICFLALLLLVAGSIVGGTCPYCAYSPSGFGFCKSDGWYGFADCDQYVADEWTGRTDCDTCGSCDPSGTVACAGSSGPGGVLNPTTTLNSLPCGIGSPDGHPIRVASGDNLSWVGVPPANIATF